MTAKTKGPDYYVDMDTLTPQDRTLTVLRTLDRLYGEYLRRSDPRDDTNQLRQKIVFTVRWIRENLDITKVHQMIQQEGLRHAADLIEIIDVPSQETTK